MVLPECPPRRQSVPALLMMVVFASPFVAVSPSRAQARVVVPRLQASFQVAGGAKVESTAVVIGDDSTVVVVTGAGGGVLNPRLHAGGRVLPVKMLGHDPVSRLAFLKVEGDGLPKEAGWTSGPDALPGQELQVLDQAGAVKCRATGRIKQVGGKVLPFALLGVDFQGAVPPPGTPLADAAGKVTAIVFQAATVNTGYAIPASAVQRVHRDVCEGGGKLVRGWLGLALRSETGAAKISRVVENSPAAGAGVRPDDLILSIGGQAVADYADAADAFFYLVPGQPVKVKVQRAAKAMEFVMVPAATPGQ